MCIPSLRVPCLFINPGSVNCQAVARVAEDTLPFSFSLSLSLSVYIYIYIYIYEPWLNWVRNRNNTVVFICFFKVWSGNSLEKGYENQRIPRIPQPQLAKTLRKP